MSIWDNIKKFAQPYSDEDYDDYDGEPDDYDEQPQEEAASSWRELLGVRRFGF